MNKNIFFIYLYLRIIIVDIYLYLRALIVDIPY